MLNESRLFNFLDNQYGVNVNFLDGQKLIQDLAVIHTLKPKAFVYFRDFVLTFQPMISFLKPQEGFGVYIDSEDPYFRLKMETNSSGTMRTLLLPEEVKDIPERISGTCRLTKTFVGEMRPYTSIIKLKDISLREIVNQILDESYQIDSRMTVSNDSDQSLMMTKLPALNTDKEEQDKFIALKDYIKIRESQFLKICMKAHNSEEEIIKAFTDLGLDYLGSREVKFKCPCTRERFIQNISNLHNSDLNDIFPSGKNSIEVRCDYCKTYYELTKKEFTAH